MGGNIQRAVDFFGRLDGVIQLSVLDDIQRKALLEIESRNEAKKLMGMARTHNKAARDAISLRHTLAIIIKGGEFKHIPFPRMRMMYGETLVGEELYEQERIEALKKSRENVFIWDNFVIFMKMVPKGKDELDKLIIIHTPSKDIPQDTKDFENLVLGEPCAESDQAIKTWARFESGQGVFGTILVGFDSIR